MLPPRPSSTAMSPEDAIVNEQARERKDALVRGVTSIQAMREGIKRAGRAPPHLYLSPQSPLDESI
ncbi:hypothetical protein RGU75_04545 [Glaciimonas sp. CA11.2]|uniref:hypothetical protein n=1 Tax=Glaciimonas sp. CA11.2 TaxID=3048601 RepID=UPI002AB4672E|nr:hypothetical protein [Glaciimonas sp. CA11.2]MDY7545500.1 hypothetical protein [Glaciimonas sp. CA11.2]